MSDAIQILIGIAACLGISLGFYRLGYRDGRKRERFEQAVKPLDHLDWTTKP